MRDVFDLVDDIAGARAIVDQIQERWNTFANEDAPEMLALSQQSIALSLTVIAQILLDQLTARSNLI